MRLTSWIIGVTLTSTGFTCWGQPNKQTQQSSTQVLNRELVRLQNDLNQIRMDQGKLADDTAFATVKRLGADSSEVVAGIKKLYDVAKGYRDLTSDDWKTALQGTGKLSSAVFQLAFKETGWDKLISNTAFKADILPKLTEWYVLNKMAEDVQSRIIATYELLAKEAPRDVKFQEEWQRIFAALNEENRRANPGIKARLKSEVISGQDFANGLAKDAEATGSTTAGSFVAQGLSIVDPDEDIWKLADIPGINPDFLHALECDRQAMRSFFSTMSNTALIQSYACRRYANGSYITAFGPAAADANYMPPRIGTPETQTGTGRNVQEAEKKPVESKPCQAEANAYESADKAYMACREKWQACVDACDKPGANPNFLRCHSGCGSCDNLMYSMFRLGAALRSCKY